MTGIHRLVALGGPTALASMAVIPPVDRGWTICPVALITGMACPGCGMTRAVSHLLHGDVTAAVELHPLVIPVLVVGLVAWGWFILHRLGRVRSWPTPLANATLAALAFALVAVWVVRLTTGSLPPV